MDGGPNPYHMTTPISEALYFVGADFALCSQLAVFKHESFSSKRSTGRPPIMWESTISSTSAKVTPAYQIASG
jgi:hypothetical protein